MLADLVFENSHPEVKNSFAKLLTNCIKKVVQVEEPYLFEEVVFTNDGYQPIKCKSYN